ncbi:MAG: hypothetical protein GF329_19515 [Candidatus Lokiarchaeota archaeon]|nr:hypothetical protein [Candidatus Lokiarchaeota archaeon]
MESSENKSIVTESGDPETFIKWKLNSLILRMVYPQVLSNFVIKFRDDISKAKEYVKDVGSRTAKRVLEEFPIKEFRPKILIRKLTYWHWGTKSKVKGKVKNGELDIIIDKCPLCHGLAPLEIEGLHYCTAFSGFLEGAFTVLQEKYDKMPQSTFTFETVESRGSNDPVCIHRCIIEE